MITFLVAVSQDTGNPSHSTRLHLAAGAAPDGPGSVPLIRRVGRRTQRGADALDHGGQRLSGASMVPTAAQEARRLMFGEDLDTPTATAVAAHRL
jgi:hypothetical protein